MGVLPEKKEIEKCCPKCNTIFTYTKSDVESDIREGNYVKCPLCKAFLNVN